MDRHGEEDSQVSANGPGLRLEEVVLLGRTYDEYAAYFALGDAELRGARVLDVGSGVSSFGAEARQRGYDVTSSDPIYGAAADEIERKCRADLEEVVRQLPSVADKYIWGTFYRDVADLARHREAAYRRFLADYRQNPDRYRRTSLPELALSDKSYSLTLVSHFLFLYDDRFDYDWHKRSLLELLRVTDGEVRVYPLANLRAEVSPFLRRFQDDGDRPPLNVELRRVPFEFLRGAQEMLVVRRG